MQQRQSIRKAYQASTRRHRAQRRAPVARAAQMTATQQPEEIADVQHAAREFGRLAQEADHLFDTSAAWW